MCDGLNWSHTANEITSTTDARLNQCRVFHSVRAPLGLLNGVARRVGDLMGHLLPRLIMIVVISE